MWGAAVGHLGNRRRRHMASPKDWMPACAGMTECEICGRAACRFPPAVCGRMPP